MIPLFDVHCHLDAKEFDTDRAQVIQRAIDAGVKYVVCNGTNPQSNRALLEMAKQFPIIKVAMGFYPVDALEFDVDAEIIFITSMKSHIIAIGEVGIDYHWVKDSTQRAKEHENFQKAIHLAKELRKPIIVHSRAAEKETLDMLEQGNIKNVVLHCFGGNTKLVERAVKLGFSLSIPPNIVRSDQFQQMVRKVPLSQLLLETDSPYLAPTKEGRNEPANVVLTVEKIAEIKNMDVFEVRNHLFMNFQRMFLQK